jgi:hypothetical protein
LRGFQGKFAGRGGGSLRPYAQATLQSAFVVVWAGDPTAEVLGEFGAGLETFVERQGTRAAVLNVITARAGMPDKEARELLRVQFEGMRGRIAMVVMAIEHRGIMGTMSRAVLSTLLTLAHRPFPMAVVADRGEGAEALAQVPGTPPPEKLRAMVSTLERQLTGSMSGQLRVPVT